MEFDLVSDLVLLRDMVEAYGLGPAMGWDVEQVYHLITRQQSPPAPPAMDGPYLAHVALVGDSTLRLYRKSASDKVGDVLKRHHKFENLVDYSACGATGAAIITQLQTWFEEAQAA